MVQQKFIQGEYTPNKLLKTLKNISIYDEKKEGAAKLWLSLTTFLFFIVIVFLVVEDLRIFSPLVVAGLVFCYVKHKKTKKLDLNNQIRYFLLPFFALIKDDIKSNSKIELYADARASISPNYKTPESPTKVNSRRRYYQYLQPWLKGSFTLADDIELAFESQKLTTQTRVIKYSASGKRKTKIKTKSVETIILSMMIPKHKYVINHMKPGIQIKEKGEYIFLKSRFRYKYRPSLKDTKYSPYLPVDNVIHTISNMYQSLKVVN
ncbi:hypothetical protein N9J26_00645 [bacterium]|nr:hypothetical protein [bacterium]